MSQHIHRIFAIAASALIAVIVSISCTTTAWAVKASGHAVGYLWSGDNLSWIGSYRLADGSAAFCLQAGKDSPVGTDFSVVEATSLGWFSTDTSAKLAYISREWAASSDPTTAAAGQLATWTLSGLNGHTQGWYASRAGSHAQEVLARTASMLAEADAQASRGVSAAISLSLPEAGTSTVRVGLSADMVASGPTAVAPGRYSATTKLEGATFDDGSTTRAIPNDTDVVILPAAAEPTVTIDVSATFAALPYGEEFSVAFTPAPVQNLLVARPARATAAAHTLLTGPSPLPFQPIVATETSATEAAPGAHVTDLLTVGVQPSVDSTLLPTWGVYESGETQSPIPVIVESKLLGPFSAPITQAASAPAGAPVVCSVEVAVTGVGTYRTPDCVLPADGWYVWIEQIAPARTAAEQGAARVRPWTSEFGVASEITHSKTPVAALANTGSNVGVAPLSIAAGVVPLGAGLIALNALRRRRSRRAHTQRTI